MATPFDQTIGLHLPKYEMGVKNVLDSRTPLLSQLKKTYTLQGTEKNWDVKLSQGAGFGSTDGSSLPQASSPKYDRAKVTAARFYGRAEIDKYAIDSAKNDGAVVSVLDQHLGDATDGIAFNMERFLMRTDLSSTAYRGTGKVGTLHASTAPTGSNPYVLTMTSDFIPASVEEGMIVNIETGNTNPFEVTAVTDTTVTVSRLSGSQAPAVDDEVFVQLSEDKDPLPIPGIVEATSGSIYNIPVGRRWEGVHVAAAEAALSTDIINDAVIKLDNTSRSVPTLCLTSATAWRQLAAQYEDLKRISIGPKNEKLKAKVGFAALEFVGPTGSFPIVYSRFCPDDSAYLLNMDDLSFDFTSQTGWDKTGGGLLQKVVDKDYYEARWCGYGNLVSKKGPSRHCDITGLSTS